MKDLVILILLSVIVFLLWNGRQVSRMDAVAEPDAAIPPSVIQAIIEKFQSTMEDMVPLETLYVKPVGDRLYEARFMFLDTRRYAGKQYDVQASIDQSGNVTIVDSTTTSQPTNYNTAFVPDKYQAYSTIEANIDKQIRDALRSRQEIQA